MIIALACLGVFALIVLVGWLDYRRICRQSVIRSAPEQHMGKPRL